MTIPIPSALCRTKHSLFVIGVLIPMSFVSTAASLKAQDATYKDALVLAPYEIQENRILEGAILRSSQNVATSGSCAAICSARSQCASFTYIPGMKICEEKGEVGFRPGTFAGYVSGIRKAESVTLAAKGRAPLKRDKLSNPIRTNTKDMVCTSRNVKISDNFDNNFVGKLEALNKALVPGALFYMNDVTSGSFSGVSNPTRLDYNVYVKFNDRRGKSQSVDALLPGGAPPAIRGVSAVRVAATEIEVNEAIRTIVESNPSNGNINSAFEIMDVTSDEQLNIAMKGAASYNGFSMNGSFGFTNNTNTQKQIAQLLQRYYAVHVDSSQIDYGVQAWIGDPEAAKLIDAQQKDRGPLVYVESVVYGRALYFSMEHTRSDLEVEAALQTAYDGAEVTASAEAQAKYKKAMQSDKIKYFAIGESVSDPTVDSMDEFRRIVTKAPDADGLGAPIAYVLRFVDDKDLAMVNVNTSYTQRDCVRLNNRIRLNLPYITVVTADDEGSGAENAIEIEAKASVRAEYDTYPNGADNPAVVKNTPWQVIHLGNAAEGGQIALGREGEVALGRNVDFLVPDDPETQTVNEALTARIRVVWKSDPSLTFTDAGETMPTDIFKFVTAIGDLAQRGFTFSEGYVYEIDNGREHFSNADDEMTGKNPQDAQRTVSLSTFRLDSGEGAKQYPSFSFVGGGNEIKIHYELSSVE